MDRERLPTTNLYAALWLINICRHYVRGWEKLVKCFSVCFAGDRGRVLRGPWTRDAFPLLVRHEHLIQGFPNSGERWPEVALVWWRFFHILFGSFRMKIDVEFPREWEKDRGIFDAFCDSLECLAISGSGPCDPPGAKNDRGWWLFTEYEFEEVRVRLV